MILNNKTNSNLTLFNIEACVVHEMIYEFLKVLFTSTKYGISFYDKTLNISTDSYTDQSYLVNLTATTTASTTANKTAISQQQQKNSKGSNHLIFNALIGIQHVDNSSMPQKTRDMIDDLLLRSFKVCPDLIQRFLKVKYKQTVTTSTLSSTNEPNESEKWFFNFTHRLFEQQRSLIRNGTFLRCFDTIKDEKMDEKQCQFVVALVVCSSIPLCLSFQKLIQPNSQKTGSVNRNLVLKLLISSLKCLKEWKDCFDSFFQCDDLQSTSSIILNIENQLIISKIFNNINYSSLLTQLNLEILTKNLPRFDLFSKLTDTQDIVHLFEIFNLYFDVFINITDNQQKNEQLTASFNLLQIESLENNLAKLIPTLLEAESKEPKDHQFCANVISLKYLKFIVKSLKLKENTITNTDKISKENQQITLKNLTNIIFSENDHFFYYLVVSQSYLYDMNHNLFDSKVTLSGGDDIDHLYLLVTMIKSVYIVLKEKNDDGKLTSYFSHFLNSVFFDLFDQKTRNSILLKLTLNSNENQEDILEKINFNRFLIYILKKNAPKPEENEKGIEMIIKFLRDFIFNSTMLKSIKDLNSGNSINESFNVYFD
jgi:hypothetical protein